MAGDDYEPNRVLGIPLRLGPRARQGEEPQRVMGFPVDMFGTVDRDWLWSLAHPILGYRRWLRRRRLGPYATDDDEPRRLSQQCANVVELRLGGGDVRLGNQGNAASAGGG